MLNWIYVQLPSRELRYGNRTASIQHTVGPWAWDIGDDDASDEEKEEGKCKGDNGGGLTLEGREGCVAVEGVEEEGGGWQLFWEDAEGKIPGLQEGGRRRLRVSVERVFAEGVEDEIVKGDEKDKTDRGEERGDGTVEGKVEVRGEEGKKREDRKTEATLEVRTKKVEEGKGKGKKKTRYEYSG
ncbi:MAG: hypothetical protein Q9184_008507 [Pyrenodesmia sp. 2 TL-2023]